ncbi:MAG: acetyl-CoA acetyltransferase [Acidimicrobiaceae bacterium]|nr:acetyl-CoA acetyltransferase [Acidimicrobiaceae bacterium]
MTRCSEAALDDTGASATVRSAIEAVRVVWGIWPYQDPGRLVAERLGRTDARTTLTTMGGNQVYDLVSDTATRIADGSLDVAVVCAAESMRTRRADHARGVDTHYIEEADGAAPDDVIGSQRPLTTDAEDAIGVHHPVRFYAMAETAVRHRLGEPIDEHRRRVASMWSRASEIAAANPHAWLQRAQTADDTARAGEHNRPIASPYPKYMTSNLNVDQGGAVIMCAAEAAERLGVPRDRWIFPLAASGAADHPTMTTRWAFDESPAMRLVGRDALGLAGVDIDDCALLDLYSCFPIAVQVAQRELDIDPARDWTITGGLTFAAGPMNCYCILPLTRAVEMLRASPTQRAFLTGNGGYFSKHSALVLAGEPGTGGFRSSSPQAEVDALPSRPTPDEPVREATIETYTVTYDRDMQPERAILACLDEEGRRHWTDRTERAFLDDLLATDACGEPIDLTDAARTTGTSAADR